jgi:uncharacterized membrane protein YdfJ with MMPL/SSD domain
VLSLLASLAVRRTRLVLVLSALVAGAAAAFGADVANRLDPIGVDTPASESFRAQRLIERESRLEPGAGVIALVRARGPHGVATAAARERVRRVVGIMAADPAVGQVASYLGKGRRALVSRDGSMTYVAARFRPSSDRHRQVAAKRLAARLRSVPGVQLGGLDLTFEQINETIKEDLRRAEMVAFPILFLLSLWFFRGLVAALLPLVLGGLAIVLTLAELRVASQLTSVSVVALNLVTALGLGLAIDYSLLIVSRFREELAANDDVPTALRRTLMSAGRTVSFSAVTVAAALSSLLLFPQQYFYSMGLGGAVVALLACAGALVVLPALLALLGPRVNAFAPARLQRSARATARPATSGGWYRLALFVMRRPVRVLLPAAAVLVALGAPTLGIRFISTDATVLPDSTSSHRVASALRTSFAVDPTRAVRVVAVGASRRELQRYRRRLARLPGVAVATSPQRLGSRSRLVELTPRAAPGSEQAQRIVRTVRGLQLPFATQVTGPTASFIDLKSSLKRHLPGAIGLVVLTTSLAIFLMTGSVVLPLKSLVMNALTVAAALGILVLVFQDGNLEGLLGYSSVGAIDVAQPVLLGAVVLGLSTDYGVFLLDRIREARAGGLADREAIALGMERTGRIVTAAALLFCVAIGALVTSRISGVKEVSFGTAAAVLLDATIVRALLVPSLMRLLGSVNWWSPAPLRRLARGVQARAS